MKVLRILAHAWAAKGPSELEQKLAQQVASLTSERELLCQKLTQCQADLNAIATTAEARVRVADAVLKRLKVTPNNPYSSPT